MFATFAMRKIEDNEEKSRTTISILLCLNSLFMDEPCLTSKANGTTKTNIRPPHNLKKDAYSSLGQNYDNSE